MSEEKRLVRNLRGLTDAYRKVKGLKLTTLSLNAYGEATFFDRVFAGKRGFTVRTYDSLVQWFSDNWPRGAEWPTGLSRPHTSAHRAKDRQRLAARE